MRTIRRRAVAALAVAIGAATLSVGTAGAAPGDFQVSPTANSTITAHDFQVAAGAPLGALATVTPKAGYCVVNASVDYGDGGGFRPAIIGGANGRCGPRQISSFGYAYANPGRYQVVAASQQQPCLQALGLTVAICSGTLAPNLVVMFAYVTSPNAVTSASANPLTATEDAIYDGQVASFRTNTCSNCTYRAAVRWGDGSETAGTIVRNGANAVVRSSHVYANQGTYNTEVVVTTTSDDGVVLDTDTVAGKATVDDAPVIASSGAVYVNTGTAYNAEIGRFTDANGNAVASDYQILVNWGDGTTGTATAVRNGTEFIVQGNHVFPIPGQYGVTFRVRSTRGQEATGTSTIIIVAGGGG